MPDHPKGWLITVASRRLTDQLRSDEARRRREAAVTLAEPAGPASHAAVTQDDERASGQDDTLMLLTEARRPARCAPDGALVPLAEQDRTRWNSGQIAEGLALVTGALSTAPLGAYQVQAAIAAVHAEAATAAETDWQQILGLYNLLERITPSPVVTLNRAVAVAMVDGPQAALGLLASLETDERMAGHHRLAAVRAHCHELAGDQAAAAAGYAAAARTATSLPERRYLEARAADLAAAGTRDAGAGARAGEAGTGLRGR